MTYRGKDTNWINRWHALTGNKPDPSLLVTKKYFLGRSIREDAIKLSSQRFRNTKPKDQM